MTDAGHGHNSGIADELKQFVERIEHLEAEIADLNESKSEIYKEAKGRGFDVKILREVVRLRRKDHAERMEHDTVLDLYLSALGMA
jgi:uncharacterized protein (UPF0335 family)